MSKRGECYLYYYGFQIMTDIMLDKFGIAANEI